MLTMANLKSSKRKIDVILTSPPYNTSKVVKTALSLKTHQNRYDVYIDKMSPSEYADYTEKLFANFDEILVDNGIILYNLSYGTNVDSMWQALNRIYSSTNFTIADVVIWKKKTCLPNNASPNRLSRICEFVFVICRKSELKTFRSNKRHVSTSKSGQKYYENITNFISAGNNDGTNPYNKATFSTELVVKLLSMYANDNCVVYDPFVGIGTTIFGCLKYGKVQECIGSEISAQQTEFCRNKLEKLFEK